MSEFAMKNLTAGQLNAIVKKLGGEEGVLKFLRDELVISEAVVKQLLERLPATIGIPAITSFTANKHFVPDTSRKAKVKISCLSDDFKKHFLAKVDKSKVVAENLVVNRLLKSSLSPGIIAALGGESKVEITIGQFFAVFAKQPNCEDGTLLTNGYANVGYVRNINGVLLVVFGFRWLDNGWFFGARPLDDPEDWYVDGTQFLSH